MAFLKPAIEWNPLSITGTTATGSAVITGIASTADVVAGQVVYGTGVPYNSRVLSKTVDSITIDQNATANGTVALTLYTRFDFQFPPSFDDGEQCKAQQKVTKSLSGVKQVQTDYIEALRTLKFGFVTKTERDTLKDGFYLAWALLGNSFRYFEDQDDQVVLTYENESADWKQKRQVKKHPDFLYEVDFKFRRVI